jgi:hypothetical protein
MNALATSGYNYKLEFNVQATFEKQNNRNRSRKVTWFQHSDRGRDTNTKTKSNNADYIFSAIYLTLY